MKRLVFMTLVLCSGLRLLAQTTFPSNGAPNPDHTTYAFINATIHMNEDVTISHGSMVIKDGKVLLVGEKVAIPAEAVVYDLRGKHLYPGFIDLYSDYGMPEVKRGERGDGPQMESNAKGPYGWNQAIKADVDAFRNFTNNPQKADELKKLGFTTVLTHQKDGIVRGSGTLVSLTNQRENENIIVDRAAGFYSFNKGTSTQDYPGSLMGAVALLRQTYYDADWYKSNQNKTEYNISLEAFNKLRELPAIFEGNDKYNDLRGDKVGKEFKVKYIIKGGGNEYQRLADIQATFARLIIPVNYPEAMDVEDPYDAEQVSLSELKHWEMAPANASFLEKNVIPFCFTSADLKDKSQFLKNVRKAIKYGLSEKTALRALTSNPAMFIGAQDKVGSLKAGMIASFFIASKNIFEDDAIIYETWSAGQPSRYNDLMAPSIEGKYTLQAGNASYRMEISRDQDAYAGTVFLKDSLKAKASLNFRNNMLSASFLYDTVNYMRLSMNYTEATKKFDGKGQLADGTWADATLTYNAPLDTAKTPAKNTTPKKQDFGKIFYPFVAFGEPIPDDDGIIKDTWKKFKNRYDAILIKDVTIWTNESDSILKDYDVYITEGKIVRIAPNIDAPKLAFAKVIDGKGKHLTPGIIDEHSHIALFSVNEGTEASSSEVRMGDVVNPEDINIYRQLAGGVTSAQLLHGSANPIGGQSCLIKLRWGKGPEEMKYEKADPFIKFALGENVKQANWGDNNVVRFPQTRMGVEQVYYDYFIRAKAYKQQMEGFGKMSPKQVEKDKIASPRRDLQLEAIAEILDNKRFITCHSYVQSELNMLMHVADSMKFKVNTFTHILEGYKVADKMKAHGINASTFADWWAYKMEVMEAIPYNAAILTREGVNTAINSDDAEMGRRLNQEAAKAVKYGHLSEIQALKLVTLNPAKMLHIDDKTGSVKVGKSADLVLWTDNPLSIYARVDKTIIDGQVYFDAEEDAKLREDLRKERARIISKLVAEKHKGEKVVKPQPKKQNYFHCDSEETGIIQN
ncbi:MAG: amidohydrolase family protein [Bacteroidetes bacterium]|nr:amidohydrolase family protein [Bacteroidota bacterium]